MSDFVEVIHDRIKRPEDFPISTPEIKPIKKDNTKACKECRPISLNNLQDRVIISLTAKYFTELFDDYFLDCSYAFRAVKMVDGSKLVRTHHSAIEKIIEYRRLNISNKIFAAECDIQKFFDCVNHDLVLEALDSLSKEKDCHINATAYVLFKQYLNSYSFSSDVFPKNDTEYFDRFHLSGAKFKWVLNELKDSFYSSLVKESGNNLERLRIGVPQGGALSCFISNLLLHTVDKMVINQNDKDLLYLRFCDDMVILHTDKEKCESALIRYKEAIIGAKLLIHEPKEIHEYSKSFWKEKSKKPYEWGQVNSDKSKVPWLAFVGYQIKYNGDTRVRKKSFIKEKRKQKEQCNEVLHALNHHKDEENINIISKKSKRQHLFALENRLISMSVGRIKLYDESFVQSLC